MSLWFRCLFGLLYPAASVLNATRPVTFCHHYGLRAHFCSMKIAEDVRKYAAEKESPRKRR